MYFIIFILLVRYRSLSLEYRGKDLLDMFVVCGYLHI